MKLILCLFFALVFPVLALATDPMSLKSFETKPKLILVIVIDQFRSDYLTRTPEKFLPAQAKNGNLGGFRYLMSKGAFYPFAEYQMLQSMTCPGHAMILSGTNPALMGIPINEWYSPELDRNIYCVEDSEAPLVGSTGSVGISPKNFIGSTVGDELKNSGTGGQVVALAMKDRSAVLLGGHRTDLAFWFDYEAYQWISSKHYLPQGQLPEWLKSFNQNLSDEKNKIFEWKFGKGPNGSKKILNSPHGNDLTVNAAVAAMRNLKLGQDSKTDILAISFSSHDNLGHSNPHGANSPELQEMALLEDHSVAALLNEVKKSIPGGLKDVLVVLTADHGVSPSAPFLADKKIPSGQIDQQVLRDQLNTEMEKKFGSAGDKKWILKAKSFNFYLNHAARLKKGTSRAELENFAKQFIEKVTGVYKVLTRSSSEREEILDPDLRKQLESSYFEGRSGDLILVPKPFYYEEGHPTTHMTGYSYDRLVPMIFLGEKFKPGVYSNKAFIADIAPTLSFLLGTMPPAGAQGRVLTEAFR